MGQGASTVCYDAEVGSKNEFELAGKNRTKDHKKETTKVAPAEMVQLPILQSNAKDDVQPCTDGTPSTNASDVEMKHDAPTESAQVKPAEEVHLSFGARSATTQIRELEA